MSGAASPYGWLPGSPLTAADYANLANCGISGELADQSLVRRVDSLTGAELFGRNGGGDYAGILFPYCDIEDRQHIVEFALRLDHPPVKRGRDGRLKESSKYLWPSRRNRLYIPPSVKYEWCIDTAIPILFAEGIKKALALWALAWHGLGDVAEKPRWIPIGLGGVSNFLGKTGKVLTADGTTEDEHGMILDFGRIPLRGRETRILFDVNVHTNDKVKAARNTLAKMLREDYTARVLFIDLPSDCGVNGVDDLIGAWGPDRVLELLQQPYDPKRKKRSGDSVESQATRLIRICQDVEFFRNPDKSPYATIRMDKHFETYPLRSTVFAAYLRGRFFDEVGIAIGSGAISDAVGVFESRALWGNAEVPVFTRVGGDNSAIYLDLGGPNWDCVEIKATGWQVVSRPPVKFQRTCGMLPIPKPIHSLDGEKKFWGLLNMKDEKHKALIRAWMVATLRPSGPYPVLVVNGQQGAAKTSSCRIMRALIDPHVAGVRSLPRDERDLVIAAHNAWMLGLDNLSHLSEWMSDAICRVSTGGGFGTRLLYANNEEALFYVCRPVIMNGIEEIVVRGDLLSRSLLVEAPTIENYLTEKEVWQIFDRDRREMLGWFIDLASYALRNIDSLKLNKPPRMADFAYWAAAAADDTEKHSVPVGKDDQGEDITETLTDRELFLAAYDENRSDANALTLESSTVARYVQAFLKTKPVPLSDGKPYWQWDGTCADLLDHISALAVDTEKKEKRWPKKPHNLSNALRRLQPNLKQKGIDVKFERRHGGTRTVTLSSHNLGE